MRTEKIIKHNDLIQKATFNFTLQQQKIILYMIGQIPKDSKELVSIEFKIYDFCKTCGIEYNGRSYNDLKKSLKTLSDKSVFIKTHEGDVLLRWVSDLVVNQKNNSITIEFSKRMHPYILELKERYTQYDLIYILAMRSKYSVRLYELLKSYENLNQDLIFTLEFLNDRVGSTYSTWQDINRRVLDPAIKEINALSDIGVDYEIIKEGRKITSLKFTMWNSSEFETPTDTRIRINQILDGSQVVTVA